MTHAVTAKDGAAQQVPLASPLLCVECCYALRTLPVEGQCPECGHAVAESLAAYRDPRPAELVAVGWLFIAAGVLGMTIIQIPLGIGLWRGVASARDWALIIIWLHLLATPVVVAVYGFSWATGRLPANEPHPIQWVYLAYMILWLPVSWWQWRVLRRPHIRRIFDLPL